LVAVVFMMRIRLDGYKMAIMTSYYSESRLRRALENREFRLSRKNFALWNPISHLRVKIYKMTPEELMFSQLAKRHFLAEWLTPNYEGVSLEDRTGYTSEEIKEALRKGRVIPAKPMKGASGYQADESNVVVSVDHKTKNLKWSVEGEMGTIYHELVHHIIPYPIFPEAEAAYLEREMGSYEAQYRKNNSKSYDIRENLLRGLIRIVGEKEYFTCTKSPWGGC